MEKRLQKLIDWQRGHEIDLCFIQSKENIFYLTNFYGDAHERLIGLFVFKNSEPLFVCPKMEVGQVKEAGWKFDLIGYGDHEKPWDLVKEEVNKRKLQSIRTVAIEKEVASFSRVESLQQVVNHAEMVSVETILNEHRLIKDEGELISLKKAAELADFGVQVGASALKSGMTEMEVLATIEFELKKKGIREMSFSTMVLFGEKSGQPHGTPGLKRLKAGDIVLFDLGVIVDGYCSDITRTFVYQTYHEQQKKIYDTVLQANLAALAASKAGVRIGDLDQIARTIITDAGFGDYFPHRLGHGVGISVHEFPSMSQNNDGKLKEGMVYTIEPGIYLPGIGGVRIEDEVLITSTGVETLTKFPKEFTVIS